APPAAPRSQGRGRPGSSRPARRPTPYDDLWALDRRDAAGAPGPRLGSAQRALEPADPAGLNHGPTGPRPPSPDPPSAPGVDDGKPRDLLRFLMENSRILADWQRDILGMVRDEMLYFWPQLETKILNEGWATYWHARIMRALDLSPSETVEFARLHASVLAPSPTHINPYHLGYHMLRDIARRRGEAYLFEVRETETDLSLVRNWLTQELVEELDLYVYRRQGDHSVVTDKDWRRVEEELVQQITKCGIPVITVADADWRGAGQLYLRHRYEGVELDRTYAEKTLPYVYRLWGRPVHLETVMDGRPTVFTCDGSRETRVQRP